MDGCEICGKLDQINCSCDVCGGCEDCCPYPEDVKPPPHEAEIPEKEEESDEARNDRLFKEELAKARRKKNNGS